MLIKVKFPDGEREIPAFQKHINGFVAQEGHAAPSFTKVLLTPKPMDGWVFAHHLDGSWSAYKDN